MNGKRRDSKKQTGVTIWIVNPEYKSAKTSIFCRAFITSRRWEKIRDTVRRWWKSRRQHVEPGDLFRQMGFIRPYRGSAEVYCWCTSQQYKPGPISPSLTSLLCSFLAEGYIKTLNYAYKNPTLFNLDGMSWTSVTLYLLGFSNKLEYNRVGGGMEISTDLGVRNLRRLFGDKTNVEKQFVLIPYFKTITPASMVCRFFVIFCIDDWSWLGQIRQKIS